MFTLTTDTSTTKPTKQTRPLPSLKMSPDLQEVLKQAIVLFLIENETSIIDAEQFYIREKLGKDPLKRFRWDLFYSARRRTGYLISDACNAQGLLNSHIDSALRYIVKCLKEEALPTGRFSLAGPLL